MPKLRKLRKAQKFNYGRNRKRLQKTQEKTKNSNIKVTCAVMKANWDASKPVKQNLTAMGLAYDANEVMSIRSTKQQMIRRAKGELPRNPDQEEEEIDEKEESEVVRKLREEANVEKVQKFRFSKEDVRWITSMMDKHGDDFKAMAKDPKNLFQLTPKQIRQKVVKFISIPEQFAEAAKGKGFLEDMNEVLNPNADEGDDDEASK